MAAITEQSQRSSFNDRIGRIQKGGPRTLGQRHAGMNTDGSSHTFGKTLKAKKAGARKKSVLVGIIAAFAIGVVATVASEQALAQAEALAHPVALQVFEKLTEVGALPYVPLVASLLIAMTLVVVTGLRGRAVMIMAIAGCLAGPSVRTADWAALTASSSSFVAAQVENLVEDDPSL